MNLRTSSFAVMLLAGALASCGNTSTAEWRRPARCEGYEACALAKSRPWWVTW